ncbi:MAG TPA: 23S rRNA (adenine(2503)-C(2))-methyltransferase RlmN [Anaerolineales bacterium]|jgi:23S rRNA (adenine2503-C2)-methyltransferase
MTSKPNIYDCTRDQLTDWFAQRGQPAYRAGQVWHWLYRQLATEAGQITTLPSELRQALDESFAFGVLAPTDRRYSSDGHTEKALLALPGQDGYIEAVLMDYRRRRTACISTQAGCALGCTFCATGQMGFKRNLSAGEIIEQVLRFERQLRQADDHLTNVVVMGMGEPFHNYEATLAALDRLNDHDGFNFGARRITVSTVGLVPAIDRFTDEGRPYQLAVSLHAADDELRSSMLPINDRYPIADLMAACRRYVAASGRRLTFEWALVSDVNDSQQQAQRLADLVDDLLCHVNLIPLNPTDGYRGGPTPQDQAQAFQSVLTGRGISCSIRLRRGIDIQAGCGQLAVNHKDPKDTKGT